MFGGESENRVQQVKSGQKIIVQIKCATTDADSELCTMTDPTGDVDSRNCTLSEAPITGLELSRCGMRGNVTVPIRIRVPIEVSTDAGVLFSKNVVNFTMYMKLGDACVGNCGGPRRGSACQPQAASPCLCRDGYSGIDCGTAAAPLEVTPNYGPIVGGKPVVVKMFSEQPMESSGNRKYRCIFNDYIAAASFLPGEDSVDSFIFYLSCTTPLKNNGRAKREVADDIGSDMAPLDISINQGQGCEIGCCSTQDPCFTGAVSDLTKTFNYFDNEPMSTESYSPLEGNTHAHTFAHDYHDGSDVPHSHIVAVDENQFMIARSLTTTYDCLCGEGDFDCVCASTKGQHDHVFYHHHSNGNVYNVHSVQLKTPPLGLPMGRPGKPRFDAQRFPFYALGANDELRSEWESTIKDVQGIEDSLIYPEGTTLEIPLSNVAGGLKRNSLLKIVLDKAAAIQVRTSAGPSGEHAIEVTDISKRGPCGRLGNVCGGVVQRNLRVDSVLIEAATFLRATISSTVSLTGSVGMMLVTLELQNRIPAGGRVTMTFPSSIAFLEGAQVMNLDDLDIVAVYPPTINGTLITSGFHQAAYQDGCRLTGTEMGDIPCLVIETSVDREAGSELTFTVTQIRMPSVANGQEIGPVMIVSLQRDADTFIQMDQIKDLSFGIVAPSAFEGFSFSVSDEIAAQNTELTFSFTTVNPILVGVINISLPISYSIGEFASDILQPSGLDFNVSVSTFPDQKQVASIILASNIEANTTVVIILRGLVNGKYPGAVGGVLDTKYTVESFDGNGFPIDQASAQPGTLLPIVLLNSRVIFDPNKLKTGSYGNLTFKFLVEAAI